MLKSHKFTLVVCLQFCLLFQALARVYYVSPAGSSHNDALSWGGALDSVQGAIDRAGPGDQVWVAGGSYQPAEQAERPGTLNPLANSFVLKDGVCLYGGFQGDESRLEDRSRADLDGNGLVEAWEFVNPSLLCAASLRPGTVLYGGTQDFTQLTVIDGFSICQGLAEGGGAAGEGGGALLPGNCVLQNCRVFDNLARAGGGAALRGNAVARRCLFTHNGLLEEGWFGLGAAVLLHDEARLENCLLINNAAAYSGGGGVAVMAEGSIEHCSIAKNLAGAAGSGVCFLGNGGSMSNSLLWGNGGHECQLRIGAQTLLHNNAVQGIYCLPGCIGLQNDNVGENGAEANDNRIDCYYACFVEPEADNYRLAAGSYLLNRALPGNNEDCAGRARTETPYADIGCYEESWPGNLCADFQVEMPLLYAQNSRVQGVLGALCPDELEASFSSENGNVSWQELDNLSAELNASKSGCWTLSMSLLPDAPIAAHWNSFSFEHEVCIRPMPLLVKADDKLWQWGSEAPELTWSLLCGSLAEGDSIAGAPFVELPDESGEYPIEQGSLLVQDGSGGSDYELHFLPGLLTCVKGEAQLYLDDFCCVYEGRPVNMPVQTYPPGLQVKLNFEGVDGTPYANSELPPKDCGRYLVRASIVDGYFGGEAIANLEITAASLLCRADDQQRAYLSPNPVFTISYEGFLGGDSQFDIVAPQALCAATEFSPVREEGYEILLQGGSARNYVLELHSGRLMLSKCAPQCNEVLISEGMYGMPLEHIMIMAYAISPQGGYVPGYFIWDSPAQLLHAGLWQCSWQFMPEDSGSFLGFSGSSLVSMVKRPLEVTALNQSKVYGEPDPELTLLVTAGSLVLGDSFNGKLQREGGENIGEYSIGQGSLSLNDSYQMSFLPGAFSIEPRLVRLQALATSKYQGEEDPPLNWQFLEGSLGFNDVFSGSLERQPGEEPGEYEILQGSLRLSSNYELLYQSGIFTLLPPPFMLLGELSLQPLSYGEALSGELLEGQVCNTITGENVPGSFVWDEEGAFLPAGNHELAWTFVPEEAVVFMPLNGTCEVEIQKACLQVSLQGEFKRKYGQPNPEFALLFDGFQFDEDENDLDQRPEIVCLAEIDSLPGKYAVALQGGASDNYSFEFEDKTLTVQFLQVAVQALAQSKEYGQPDPELSYSYSGEMLPGDSFAGTLKRASGENLGLYAINLGSLSLPPYYKLSFTTENLYIGQAQICVKAADLTQVYGFKMPTLTYEIVSGALRTGDSFSGTLACETWQQWVGEYPVTQGNLKLSQNYLLEFIPGSVQVQPRPLTITAGNLNKYYSQADPKNTLSYTTSSSLVSGDSW
ncbi:MAG: MBG domain-containing protein, partial [Lentisphaeria bacterium]|nr:MBG domain-containing protein [Lentisphaeria bacterium]